MPTFDRRRPTLLLVAVAVVTLAVGFALRLDPPPDDTPLPFSISSGLQGAVTDVGRKGGKSVTAISFALGEVKETLPQDALSIVILSDDEGISDGAPLSVALTSGKRVFGYKYTSRDAVAERAAKALADAATPLSLPKLFLGQFFASTAARTDQDFIKDFENQGITFLPPEDVILEKNSRYVFLVLDAGTDLTVRDLAWCGDGTTKGDEHCIGKGLYKDSVLGADGLPVISFADTRNRDLKVMRCGNAACSAGNIVVTVNTIVDFHDRVAPQENSIAIGNDGFPIISYFENNALHVVHCSDASCTSGNVITTVDRTDFTGAIGLSNSIAIGSDGLPVISYSDDTNNALKVMRCGNASCSSGNTTVIVDRSDFQGKYAYISIAIGSDGLPVISYYDLQYKALKVLHCGDASCSSGNSIVYVDSIDGAGEDTSIAIGSDGLPIVSYSDGVNGDLKVAHCGDASCSSGNTVTVVDSAGRVGMQNSIAIGDDWLPIISYWDYTNNDLKVAHCGNAACSSENTVTTVDGSNTAGRHTSIIIGDENLPIIFHSNERNTIYIHSCGNKKCSE